LGVRLAIKFHQGSTAVITGSEQFRVLGRLLMRNVYVQMQTVAAVLTEDLMKKYATHERARVVGEPLLNRLTKALYGEVTYVYGNGSSDLPPVRLQYFDLALMARLTSTPDDKIDERGWFSLFEDGETGVSHRSNDFGFAPRGWAINMAQLVAEENGMNINDRSEFLQRIAAAFAGKHNEGIMVRLRAPLFKEFPNGPTAEEAGIQGHPGFDHWNIWRGAFSEKTLKRQMKDGSHPIAQAVRRAIDNTASQAASYFGRGGLGYIPGVRMGGNT